MRLMRHLTLRQQMTLSLILTVIIEAGCGGSGLLKSFRDALASSAPLVNSLVAAGTIPQTKASAIIADFDAGAQCGLTLQNEFRTATTRAEKFQASSRALTCFRVIINRQNFAAHPRVQQVANIAEGILQSLVIFYSDSPDSMSGPRRAPVSEKVFEEQMKARVEALKQAMKP